MVDANTRTAHEAVRDALLDDSHTIVLVDVAPVAADDLIRWLYEDGWMLVPMRAEGAVS